MFKVGDRVRVLETGCIGGISIGDIVTVSALDSDGSIGSLEEYPGFGHCDEWYEKVDSFSNKIFKRKTISNIVDKIKLALKSEPEKSLIKAGIFNESEELTSDGRTVLEMILVDKYKTELKEKADIILAEEK